jgi:hypothetical protein
VFIGGYYGRHSGRSQPNHLNEIEFLNSTPPLEGVADFVVAARVDAAFAVRQWVLTFLLTVEAFLAECDGSGAIGVEFCGLR